MKLERILVPLDGSALAESALGRATELAQMSGAQILLLRAVEAHVLLGTDPTDAQVEVVQDGERYLAGIAARLNGTGIKDVVTSVWYGPPAFAIVEAARLRKADLIVMNSHGRSGLGRLVLGSVAESVLRGTTTPILLIRTQSAPVEQPVAAGRAEPWAGQG